jgi:hypothetical protein
MPAGGQTAWHTAAREGCPAVLREMAAALTAAAPGALRPLRELGSSAASILERLVQQPDSKGLTPLHLACIKGHDEAAGLLMELGANPFAMVGVRWCEVMCVGGRGRV